MTYSEQFQEREIRQQTERMQQRIRVQSERSRVVASSVRQVVENQPWWPGLDDLAKAAYAANGASQNPWFGDADKGFDRFKRAIRSTITKGELADQGIVIYIGRDGAGKPDMERVRAKHAQVQLKLTRAIEDENLDASIEASVFKVEIPRFELRQLTDGGSDSVDK